MTLFHKKSGREERAISAAALGPGPNPNLDAQSVEEQKQLYRVLDHDIVEATDMALAGHAGIERTLTPAMIIGQAALAATASEKRADALKSVFGIWKDRQDVPEDGLVCQQEMRAEWR